ncbi:anti-anti-sigma regulatory factor [Paraperlucidibaca baekdonensis]|uniref:Anti-anti-sigma regulatory factor n=1 Tax=Paraperlucidibaca baekdonensis TaxID=748120 RepID=A0A3E0H6A4_9GAMM|nr:STAS domain-containing protein [Paraperlucidibaca baekdonensis]REH38728.1 anti-anti-sigma regulatory factor [Paraperlucidibaca baekdonensis]
MSYAVAGIEAGLRLSGRVDYSNASAAQQAGEAVLATLSAGEWRCELSALETGSSVTAAVLMAWQRYALAHDSRLVLTQAPERLVAILAASNLAEVFAVEHRLEGMHAS